MKRRILAFFIVLILTGITVGMKFAADPAVDQWLRRKIVEQAEKHLGVQVQLGMLERNITLTRLALTDVTLKDLKGSGNSITVSRLVVEVDPYAFLRGRIHIRDLKLEGMSLKVVRNDDGTVSVDPLFPFWQSRDPVPGRAVPLGFELGNVAFLDVNLSYRDVPADLTVQLDNVVILLTRTRFDPPDRRTLNIRAKKGDIAWRVFPDKRKVAINSLSGTLTVTPEELKIAKLGIGTGPLSLTLSGTLPFTKDAQLNGELSVALNIGELPWLVKDSSGRITLEGNVGGDLAFPSFRGQLGGRDVRVAGRVMSRMSADIHLDTEGCTLRSGKFGYKGEELQSEVDLDFRRYLPFRMLITAQHYPFFKLLEEVGGSTSSIQGDVSMNMMVTGQLSGGPSTVHMGGEMRFPVGGKSLRDAEFDLTGRYEKGSFGDLLLKVASGTLDLNLRGELSPGGPALELSLDDDHLAGWRGLPGVGQMGGSLALTGAISGSWADPAVSVDLEIQAPSWNRLKGDLLQAHVDMGASGLNLPMLTVKVGSCVLVGQATLPWNGSSDRPWVNVNVADGRIEDLLMGGDLDLPVTGEVGGNLYLSSVGAGWEAGGKLTLRDGRVLQEPFEEVSLAGSYTKGLFTADRIYVLKDGRGIEGSGVIRGDEYSVKARTLAPVLAEGVEYLKIVRVPLGGEFSLSGAASGKTDGTQFRARVDLETDQVTYDGRTWRSASGVFLFDGPMLDAQADLMDGTFSAAARVDLRGEMPFSGTISTPATVDRVRLNDFLGLGIPGDMVSGHISVNADASGILTNVNRTRVKGIITTADFRLNGIHFTSEDEIPFDYYPETGIRFTRVPLRSGGSVIGGDLRIAPDAGIEGNLGGSVDLEGLTFLQPTVDSFVGQAGLQLKIAGRLGEPSLNGSIELLGAECLAHLPFSLPVKELSGKLEIVGNRLHIGEIRGRPEGGQVLMSGDLFLAGFKPVQGAIQFRAEAVPVEYPDGLSTVNRADLGLKFSDGRGFLRGTVNMDQGVFTREVDIDNLIALIGEKAPGNGKTQVEESDDKEGRWLNLDVEMVTSSPLEIDIKLLRGEAMGSLHLRGTAADPVLTGQLEIVEGSIEYRAHVFEVTSGSVGFTNPKEIEPGFDFSARTEVTGFDREGGVTDYTVELLARGVPDKFKLDLISSPVLSEGDIVSLLTWGAVGERAFASRSGLSATEATLLLTRELKGKLETEVERVIGFDRFTINPASISSKGERTTRIQVDKKLGEKFFLTYSTPVLASEEQEVTVKYRITRSLSLVGEQSGERDFGLDLDFQFEIP